MPAIRFGTDPADVILEDNDVVFVMASDSLTNIATAYSAIFEGTAADLFNVTSIRKGFVDATQLGGTGQSLTKQFALANGVAGADLIPDQAQLFLGFTSTQTAALGPSTIANFESLGMTNQTTDSYFAYGTTLALSHLFEDLVSWYGNPYRQRVSYAFRPKIAQRTPVGTLTIPESMAQIEHPQQINQDARRFGVVGHSASMQPVSRLQKATRGFAKGSAIPVRADFNTVDNPFSYSSESDSGTITRRHRPPGSISSPMSPPASTSSGCARPWTVRLVRRSPCSTASSGSSVGGIRRGSEYLCLAPAELPHPAPSAPVVPPGRAPLVARCQGEAAETRCWWTALWGARRPPGQGNRQLFVRA